MSRIKEFAPIIIASIALVLLGALFLSPAKPTVDNSDLLNGENLTRAINDIRWNATLPSLTDDPSLIREVGEEDLGIDKGSIVYKFTTLHGDYYSVHDLMQELLAKPSVQAILLAPDATRIGAWVTYHVASKDAKPVPYISVLIK